MDGERVDKIIGTALTLWRKSRRSVVSNYPLSSRDEVKRLQEPPSTPNNEAANGSIESPSIGGKRLAIYEPTSRRFLPVLSFNAS
jgi:hypothetical protein